MNKTKWDLTKEPDAVDRKVHESAVENEENGIISVHLGTDRKPKLQFVYTQYVLNFHLIQSSLFSKCVLRDHVPT